MSSAISERIPFVVAVTGAQGVGKSTFCQSLTDELKKRGLTNACLLDGLGDRLRKMGVPLGIGSTPETIAAVFSAHLARESTIVTGPAVLDRCVVDALAYARRLSLSGSVFMSLYEGVAALSARRYGLIIELELSSFFRDREAAAHETTDLRRSIASEITLVLNTLGRPVLRIDAFGKAAVDRAASAIVDYVDR